MPDDNPERLHVLVSFAYWRNRMDLLDTLPPEWNVMLDSGAFTNFTGGKSVVSLADFTSFCRDHQERFWRVINLDKIGDPAASARNAEHLRRHGVRVVPVFQRGDTPDNLRAMAGESSLIAVGGISQNLKARTEQQYIHDVMRLASRVECDVHLLGAGVDELMRYRPYSGDNSTWTIARRFGILHAWNRTKMVRIAKVPSESGSKGYVRPDVHRTRLLAQYGLRARDLTDPDAWATGGRVCIASARSYIRAARTLARSGARYVFALAPSEGDLDHLRTAWEVENARR